MNYEGEPNESRDEDIRFPGLTAIVRSREKRGMFAAYSNSTRNEEANDGEEASTSSTTPAFSGSSFSSFPVSRSTETILRENERRRDRSLGNRIITLSESDEGSDYAVQIVHVKAKKKKKRRDDEKQKKKKRERKKTPPRVEQSTTEKWSFLDDRCSILTPTSLFIVDRRFDGANFQFEKLYEGNTAKILPLGRHLLGSNAEIDEKIFGHSPTTAPLRYFSPKNIRRFISSTPMRRVIKTNRLRDFEEFIPLFKQTIQDEESGETLMWNEATGMYQSIDVHKEEPLSEYEMDAVARSQAMNKQLQETPENVTLWLKFIDIQDELFLRSDQTNKAEPPERKAERLLNDKQLLERKLAIVDKAIRSNARSMTLRIKRLEIGRSIWDPLTIANEWNQLEFKFVNSLEMWNGRLLVNQNKVNTFNLVTQLGLMERCIERLSALLTGRLLSHTAEPDTEAFMASVIVKRCRLLLAAGLPEKALASAQAAMEFLYPPPMVVALKFDERKALFEQFWQSGAPLIGEVQSKGWRNFAGKVEGEEVKDLISRLEKAEIDYREMEDSLCENANAQGMSDGALWSQLERTREQKLWMPIRHLDMDLEDEERRVLFEDVSMCLLDFKSTAVKRRLIFDLIQLFGGRIIGEAEVHALDVLRQFGVDLPLQRDCFEGRFDVIDLILQWAAEVLESDRILLECSRLHTRSWFLMRQEVEPGEKQIQFRSFAKKLFEHPLNRFALPIYATYAEELVALDWQKEAVKVARQTLTNVPKSFWSETNDQLAGALRLLCLLTEHCPDTIDLLCSFGINGTVKNKEKISVTERIRAKMCWQDRIATKSKAVSWQGSCQDLARVCYARLCYQLASRRGDRLRDALAVINAVETPSECLVKAQIAITTLHCHQHRDTSPKILKTMLRDAVDRFPDNIVMLKQFIDSSFSSLIDLQRFFNTSFQAESSEQEQVSLVRSVGAVYMEYRRYIALVERSDSLSTLPEIHRIRSQLERAAKANSRGAHSDIFWHICLHLERMRNDPKMVKQVFYRAVQECSWSRALYLACVEVCPEELNLLVDLATEKAIRVRIPVEALAVLTGRNMNEEDMEMEEEDEDD